MTAFFNKLRIGLLPVLLAVLLSSAAFLSCDKEELEIQHEFPFEVNAMPVPKDIANGDTVEIRLTITLVSTDEGHNGQGNATPSIHSAVQMLKFVDNLGGNGTTDPTGIFSIIGVEN